MPRFLAIQADGRLATTVEAERPYMVLHTMAPKAPAGTLVFLSADGGTTWSSWKAYGRARAQRGIQWQLVTRTKLESFLS